MVHPNVHALCELLECGRGRSCRSKAAGSLCHWATTGYVRESWRGSSIDGTAEARGLGPSSDSLQRTFARKAVYCVTHCSFHTTRNDYVMERWRNPGKHTGQKWRHDSYDRGGRSRSLPNRVVPEACSDSAPVLHERSKDRRGSCFSLRLWPKLQQRAALMSSGWTATGDLGTC